MGAQDSFALAQDFVERTGTDSFTMFWDESFDSWRYYEVTGQPTAILVDATGQLVQRWQGVFPADEVLELAAGL